MSAFLRLGAYIFHPILMPLVGTILYYIVTPRFFEYPTNLAHILAVGILTLIVPIIFFFLLRNFGVLSSIHLKEVKERKIPLMVQSVLVLLLVKFVFHPWDSTALYYFFLGILFTTMSALILVFFSIKVSLHQMGIAGVTFFLVFLSIHFEINLLPWIAFFFVANGWVASSRLHTQSHNNTEIIIGFFIGAIPQLILVPHWL